MRYLLLRNEESVRDVAEKAYKGLSAKARKQAEAALLKANPELKTFASVRKGFIVRVPNVADFGKKDRRNLIDPIEDITHSLAKHLESLEVSFAKTFADMEGQHDRILENLKAANKEIKKQANGDVLAKTLKKHVADSKKSSDKNLKLGLEALHKLQKTSTYLDR
jgi:hypothetical protein